MLVFDGTRSIGLYNFQKDVLLRENLLTEKPEVAALLETKIKAVIQQYNNRMIEDKLVVGIEN